MRDYEELVKALRERLKCGWSVEKALFTPVRQRNADMRGDQ